MYSAVVGMRSRRGIHEREQKGSYRNNFAYVGGVVQIQKYRCCQLRLRVRVGVRIYNFVRDRYETTRT